MKKLFSLIMCAAMVFVCLAAYGAPVQAAEALPEAGSGLTLYPSQMTLPMFSAEFGERLRAFWDGTQISASYFSWSSSDTRVLTVNQQGSITPVSEGTATVTITDGDNTATCEVTVVDSYAFTTLQDVEFTSLNLPLHSDEIGIGPLCGAEPVIMKRFIVPPSCSQDDCPDPNDIIADLGWVYTYAKVYRFRAEYGHSYVFSTAKVQGGAASAYVCVYDQFFNLWEFNKGTTQNPFGTVSFTSYEDSYFYLVISPVSHTSDSGSGVITLHAYDEAQPYAPEPTVTLGDVDCDGSVSFSDVATLYQYVVGAAQLTEQGILNGNVDGSVGISFADVSTLCSRLISAD